VACRAAVRAAAHPGRRRDGGDGGGADHGARGLGFSNLGMLRLRALGTD
jgi:hypothetical protein